LENWRAPDFDLPQGKMNPEGYVLLQHMERMSRPVLAYEKWVKRIPETYRETILKGQPNLPLSPGLDDPNCLARLKHYRSLAPMAQESRKPIFHLTSADGAIGSHSQAVKDAWNDFHRLASRIANRICL